MIYKWKVAGLMPVDAQTAGEELNRIYTKNGALNPADIVDESRPEDAPLHDCFEWRDDVAAEKYREQQDAPGIRRQPGLLQKVFKNPRHNDEPGQGLGNHINHEKECHYHRRYAGKGCVDRPLQNRLDHSFRDSRVGDRPAEQVGDNQHGKRLRQGEGKYLPKAGPAHCPEYSQQKEGRGYLLHDIRRPPDDGQDHRRQNP